MVLSKWVCFLFSFFFFLSFFSLLFSKRPLFSIPFFLFPLSPFLPFSLSPFLPCSLSFFSLFLDVTGDGNCQFHAVSRQLQDNCLTKISHEELRKQTVAWLRKVSLLFIPFLPLSLPPPNPTFLTHTIQPHTTTHNHTQQPHTTTTHNNNTHNQHRTPSGTHGMKRDAI